LKRRKPLLTEIAGSDVRRGRQNISSTWRRDKLSTRKEGQLSLAQVLRMKTDEHLQKRE
jgi:hypothetical protein